ncbi:hypothetical protein A7K50_12405 [Dehalobacter sp. MCB1]|uniref:hypothetical protein n=1 Tax=Dehalobacter sp. MCB1 TaxID=1844756 RepID=UPI000E6D3D31|nr:hypothetical protein [Dehalobacter sp. MCB1]RJE46820.1 hypothetical protein A7K50_12405 [Dehalobacter sp. MCB1]
MSADDMTLQAYSSFDGTGMISLMDGKDFQNGLFDMPTLDELVLHGEVFQLWGLKPGRIRV